ncbi:MAG: hypothetical protein ABIH42_00665, partial [Planctomycetota bacterium]
IKEPTQPARSAPLQKNNIVKEQVIVKQQVQEEHRNKPPVTPVRPHRSDVSAKRRSKISASLVVFILIIVGGVAAFLHFSKKPGGESSSLEQHETATTEQQETSKPEDTNKELIEKKAEEEYFKIRDFAQQNPTKREEIIKLCSKLVQNFSGTAASQKATKLKAGYEKNVATTDNTSPSEEEQSAEFFQRLSLQALQFRTKGQYAKSIDVYDQFPESLNKTEYYQKVQNEKLNLRGLMAEKYTEDMKQLNRLLADKNFEAARELPKEMGNYVFPDTISELQKEIEKYIEYKKANPEDEFFSENVIPISDVTVEKLHTANNLYENNNQLNEALKLYNELLELENISSIQPDIDIRKKDIERYFSVVDAAAKGIAEQKGQRKILQLEESGSVSGIVDKVEDRVVTISRGRVQEKVEIENLKTNLIHSFALEVLPRDEPETYLSTGIFMLVRGDKTVASKELYEARKRGGDVPEIRRISERISSLSHNSTTDTINIPESISADTLYEFAKSEFYANNYIKAYVALKKLLYRFQKSAVVTENKVSIDHTIKTCESKLRSPYEKLFNTKVIARPDIGETGVELFYDFSDSSQLKDWKDYQWCSIYDLSTPLWQIKNNELTGKGPHGLLWKGVITGKMSMEFEVTSLNHSNHNMQAAICDDGIGSNYLFALGLTKLGSPYDIIYRNEKFVATEKTAWRLSTSKSLQKYLVRIVKEGKKLKMYVDRKLVLSSQNEAYVQGHMSLFASGSEVKFDNLTITGELAQDWLKSIEKKE